MKTIGVEIPDGVSVKNAARAIKDIIFVSLGSNCAVRELPAQENRANFLWPHEDGSIEEAGYEFANGKTGDYLKEWWDILKKRIRELPAQAELLEACKVMLESHFNLYKKVFGEKSDPEIDVVRKQLKAALRSAQPEQGQGGTPRIYTRCPACFNDTLTINKGHLLCTWHECPNPTLIDLAGEPQPPAKVDDKNLCVWKWDTDGFYLSDCGASFCLNDGTLKENEMYFCHKCGKKIKENCHAQGEERYEK
jgi:hypothetical protein